MPPHMINSLRQIRALETPQIDTTALTIPRVAGEVMRLAGLAGGAIVGTLA